jgi:hypothetical protein
MGRAARLKRNRVQRAVRSAANVARRCPDFELAPFGRFAPDVLASNDPEGADAFVLTLALAFNDMKGLQWWRQQLEKCRPEPEIATEESGQWQGMMLQIGRLTLLTLHEMLDAINRADERVFTDQYFVKALSRVRTNSRRRWQELINLANDRPGDSKVRKYIMMVRHNFAAHYYQPTKLLEGYREFFVGQPRSVFNEHALASFGDRIEATRFYFADAAAQMGQELLGPLLIPKANEYVIAAFNALRFLIEAYLQVKQKSIETSTQERR